MAARKTITVRKLTARHPDAVRGAAIATGMGLDAPALAEGTVGAVVPADGASADEARERFDRRNPFGVMRETVDVFGADQFASILATVRTIRISGAIAEVKDATGGKLQVIAVRRDNG